jgi:hypothetical protein
MMFVSKLPLPALPADALGVSARHSKWPRPLLHETANFVKIGANELAPVPPQMIEVPPPWTEAPSRALPV